MRSSLDTRSQIGLSVVNLSDEEVRSDDQGAETAQLGPHATPVSISSADGLFVANTTATAVFSNAASGTFTSTQTYDGDRAPRDVNAQSFLTTLSSIFEYDFTLTGEGSARFQGTLSNSGPSFIGFTARVNVFSEFMPGSGFTGSFFEQQFTDPISPGSTSFDVTVPLIANSGSYRVQIRLSHSGSSSLETPVEIGSTTIDWTISAPAACPADFAPVGNPDGVLNFFDIAAFINAFTAMDPAADFAPAGNPDGVFNFFDVSAYITAFNAGCP